MSDVKKLTEEEHQLLKDLQKKFSALTTRYGELYYSKKVAEAELILADKSFDDLDAEQHNIIKLLQEKYGVGQINITTGEFLPDK